MAGQTGIGARQPGFDRPNVPAAPEGAALAFARQRQRLDAVVNGGILVGG
jgi:hypothetical protein